MPPEPVNRERDDSMFEVPGKRLRELGVAERRVAELEAEVERWKGLLKDLTDAISFDGSIWMLWSETELLKARSALHPEPTEEEPDA